MEQHERIDQLQTCEHHRVNDLRRDILSEVVQIMKKPYLKQYLQNRNIVFQKVYMDRYMNHYRFLFFICITHGQRVTYSAEYMFSKVINEEYARLETLNDLIHN